MPQLALDFSNRLLSSLSIAVLPLTQVSG